MRLVVLGLVFVGWIGTAAAQTPVAPPAVLEQVYACAALTGESERLACYDSAVGRLREAQTSGAFVGVDRVQAEELNRESFGFSLPSLPRLFGQGGPPETPSVSATLERISRGGDGKALFFLSNGQVWAQIDTESVRNVRSGAAVTVRRAAMGSFMLSPEDSNRAFRVRRHE